MSDLLTLIVTGLLGGGLVGGVASLITGHALARKTNVEAKGLDAKLPAEIDSVVVQGAESAVLTMRSALESATARIKELETDRENDRKRIGELSVIDMAHQIRGQLQLAPRNSDFGHRVAPLRGGNQRRGRRVIDELIGNLDQRRPLAGLIRIQHSVYFLTVNPNTCRR